jgi:Zn-dependent peptidase ImmA (M78 family)
MRAVDKARREARRILELSQVRRLPVPVERIAHGLRAEITYESMSDEISGMLIPMKLGSWVIVVNKDHSEVRQRFTIAHELGHLLLHGYTTPHADRSFRVRRRDTASSDGSILEEIEANQFAAELLMPEDMLLRKLREEGLDYAPTSEDDSHLTEIAQQFKVSRQALSIRLSNIFV